MRPWTKECPKVGAAFALMLGASTSLSLSLSPSSNAFEPDPALAPQLEAPRCYQWLNRFDNPERTEPLRPGQDAIRETWCYEDHEFGGHRARYIYNIDSGEVRPELAALVELEENGKPLTITHGSLDHGQTSIHRMADADLNPLPAPVEENEARSRGTLIRRAFDFNIEASAQNVLNALLSHSEQEKPTYFTVQEGVFESYLPKNKLPWRGYWWARGTLEGDDDSPLNLYDSIVKNWTGKDPRSRDWEARNHDSSTLEWTGHCNGWAASALLYPEPRKRLWDPIGRRTIDPGQIKGMLAESAFCVESAFYGHRYWGNPGDRLDDIYPALFHKVLLYYIDGLQKAVAHDYERGVEVDNHVITGYRFEIKRLGGQDGNKRNSFSVTAKLRVHEYDKDYDPESTGEPDSYTRTYRYILTASADGRILGGRWTGGDNPDFLWVPLAQANCGWKNPYVDQKMIDRIQTEFKPRQGD